MAACGVEYHSGHRSCVPRQVVKRSTNTDLIHRVFVLVWLLWLPASSVPGMPMEARQAAPFLQVYNPEDYQAHGQNWDFLQLDDGRMVIGNGRGVLIYDGERFEHLVPTDGFSAIRLERTAQGRHFVISGISVGELVESPDTGFEFVEIFRFDEQDNPRTGLSSAVIDDQVWVMTTQSLFCFCNDRFTRVIHDPARPFNLLHAIGGRLVAGHRRLGLVEVVDAELIPIIQHPLLDDTSVTPTTTLPDGRMLMLGGNQGGLLVGLHDGDWFTSQLSDHANWQETSDYLDGSRVRALEVLADGRIAVATTGSGVFVFSEQGELDARIDQVNGLPVDTVLGLGQDAEGGLWIAMTVGFARAEIHQTWRRLDERHNLRSTTHGLSRVNGQLWAATSAGVWRMSGRRFEAVPELDTQAWFAHALTSADDEASALVGTSTGLYHWTEQVTELLIDDDSAFAMTSLGPTHWLVGGNYGLVSVCRSDNQWQLRRLPENEATIRSLVTTDSGTVWAGSLDGAAFQVKGLVADCADSLDAIEVNRFAQDRGLPESNYVEVYLVDGQVRFGTRFGILRLDESGQQLVPDDHFEPRLHDGTHGWYKIAQDRHGRIHAQILKGEQRWGEVLARDEDGIFRALPGALSRLPSSQAEGYLVEANGLWLHGHRSLEFTTNPLAALAEPTLAPRIHVMADSDGPVLRVGEHIIPRDRSSLSFRFSLPMFDFPEGRRWRSRLVGFDQDWSPWTELAFREYTNLPGGRYQLDVQARDGLGQLSPVSSLSFEIAQPWYISPWALTTWALLALGLLALTAQLARARQAARNRQLEQVIAQRTEEIRQQRDRLATMAYQDPLTGLANRRAMYRQLDAAWLAAAEHSQPLALLAIDLNDFKQTNDRFGHPAGDLVLQRLAEVLRSSVEAGDQLFRIGGDEFIILSERVEIDHLISMARQLATSVEDCRFDDIAAGIRAGISIGVVARAGTDSWQSALELVDRALYRAKRAGNSNIAVIKDDGSISLVRT